MNSLIPNLLSVLLAIAALVLVLALRRQQYKPFANIANGTYHGRKTYRADAAINTTYLLVKPGSDASHVAVSGAADIPLAFATDQADAAEDAINVNLLGSTCETQIAVAGAAITAGQILVGAAAGKVIPLPAAAGTYYIVGRALTDAAADGEKVEIDPCFPTQRIVA